MRKPILREVETVPLDRQRMIYTADRTIFFDTENKPVQFYVGSNTPVLVIGSSFLSLLWYASQLQAQCDVVNLCVFDINPFVIQCWELLKSVLMKAEASISAEEFAEKFMAEIIKSVFNKRTNHEPILSIDSFVSYVDAQGGIAPLAGIFNKFGLDTLKKIVLNAEFYTADLLHERNVTVINAALSGGFFSVLCASNVLEMSLVGINYLAQNCPPEVRANFVNARHARFVKAFKSLPFDVSLHFYTRRKYSVEAKISAHPSHVMVLYKPEDIPSLLEQMDCMFASTHPSPSEWASRGDYPVFAQVVNGKMQELPNTEAVLGLKNSAQLTVLLKAGAIIPFFSTARGEINLAQAILDARPKEPGCIYC